MIRIYSIVPSIDQPAEDERLLRFSPGGRGRWHDLQYTERHEEADIYTVFWPVDREYLKQQHPPKSVINLTREPSFHEDRFLKESQIMIREYGYAVPSSRRENGQKTFGPETLFSRWVPDGPISAVWWIGKSYDDLNDKPFPNKTKLASCVITGRFERPGHRLRLRFLKRFAERHPGVLDVYGRSKGGFDLNQIPGYRGPVEDKWEALAPYRYAFAFENTSQSNFWGEQLNDAILAGCFPIYWGCINLETFLPQDSFHWLDITKPDALDHALSVFKSDYREEHLKDLYEAKHRILNKYQYWPDLHNIINDLISGGVLDLDELERRRNEYQYIY